MIHVLTYDYFKMPWRTRTISAVILILFVLMGVGAIVLCKNSNMLPEKHITKAYDNIKYLMGSNDDIVASIKAECPKNEYVQTIEYITNCLTSFV